MCFLANSTNDNEPYQENASNEKNTFKRPIKLCKIAIAYVF